MAGRDYSYGAAAGNAYISPGNNQVFGGSILDLQPANSVFPGIISTSAQTFAGAKTFQNSSQNKTIYAEGGLSLCSTHLEISTRMNFEPISWDQHLFMVREMRAEIDDLKDRMDHLFAYINDQ
jgi:hypothetical protein